MGFKGKNHRLTTNFIGFEPDAFNDLSVADVHTVKRTGSNYRPADRKIMVKPPVNLHETSKLLAKVTNYSGFCK
jgi:hypothetical protein